MKKWFLIISMLASGIAAQDITVSKDSIKVYNNSFSSFADHIVFTNNASSAIQLDSVFLLIDEMDTTGLAWDITEERLQVGWRENLNTSLWFNWNLEQNGEKKYRMTFQSSSPAGAQPLSFDGQNTQRGIAMMAIGGCIWCFGLPPGYPSYFKGLLVLHFSNGQTMEIRLYSDDLRKKPSTDTACIDYKCDSLVVRHLLDINGMPDVPVGSFSTESNGRIVSLRLSYNPAAAVSLPKQLTMLPPEIGKLTALISLAISGNLLDSLPWQIGRCSALTGLYAANNRLVSLPDSIISCSLLKSLALDNNRLESLPFSIERMRSLAFLSLANNRLSTLPITIEKLDSLQCFYIEGNSICALPDNIAAWLKAIPTNNNCSRYEPVWPESQRCSETVVVQASARQRLPNVMLRHSVRGDNSIIIEIDYSAGAVRRIEVFDLTGKRMESIDLPADQYDVKTIRLNAARYPTGWYYLRITSGASYTFGHSLFVERK